MRKNGHDLVVIRVGTLRPTSSKHATALRRRRPLERALVVVVVVLFCVASSCGLPGGASGHGSVAGCGVRLLPVSLEEREAVGGGKR
jgi:hypothetical protein